jgi:hypothetical protein
MFRPFSNRRAKFICYKKSAKIVAIVPTQVAAVLITAAPTAEVSSHAHYEFIHSHGMNADDRLCGKILIPTNMN